MPCNLVLVAVHPHRGVALVDVLPEVTPEPELRLLKRLRRSGFDRIFGPKPPPVLHLALPQERLPALDQVLAEAFRDQPKVNYPGDGAWVDMVVRVVSPELPLSSQLRPSAGRIRMRPARSRQGWWRFALIAAAVEVAVAIGLWAMWPSRPRPAVTSAIGHPVAAAPAHTSGPPPT